MFEPSLETLKTLEWGDCHYAPLKKEIYADLFTPIIVIKKLKTISSHCFILESNEDAAQWGRYTFIGFNPKHEFTCKKGRMKFDQKYGVCKNPANYIRRILKQYKSLDLPDFPTLTGGLIGYFAYDYIQYKEPTLQLDGNDDEGFKDVDLMVFDELICFDHFRQKIAIIVNVNLDDLENDYLLKCRRIEELEDILKRSELEVSDPLRLKTPFQPLYNKKTYSMMVDKGKDIIHQRALSQLVLSNRYEADCAGSLIDTYRILRTTNPSPYMFYFSSASMEIAGASPKTLAKLEGNTLYTFPITATRKNNHLSDILSDEKEIAKHQTLVDYCRQDLCKVSKPESIELIDNHTILTFSKVTHIVSEFQSQLLDGCDAMDAITAIVPPGTLSGVPKIKACQIINDLENNKRGLYGGAFGYLDFKGNMDTCIGIRLAYKRKNKVYVRSDTDILEDSVPEKEYQECFNKALTIIEALEQSKGGIDS